MIEIFLIGFLLLPITANLILFLCIILCKFIDNPKTAFFLLKIAFILSSLPNLLLIKNIIYFLYDGLNLPIFYNQEDIHTVSVSFFHNIILKDHNIQKVIYYILLIWIIVSAFIMVIIGLKQYKGFCILRKSFHMPEEETRNLVMQVSEQLKINRTISVFQTKFIYSPMLVGILQPYILIPDNWNIYTIEEKKMILSHELTHYKRRDIVFIEFIYLFRIIYWYNPIFLYYNKILNLYSELACDEKILEVMSLKEKAAYAKLLWKTAKVVSQGERIGLSFLKENNKNDMTRRIENIMKLRKKNKIISTGILTSIFVIGSTILSCASTTGILVAQDKIIEMKDIKVEEKEGIEYTEVEGTEGEGIEFSINLNARGITELEIPLPRWTTAVLESLTLAEGDSVNVVLEAQEGDSFKVGVGIDGEGYYYVTTDDGAVNHRFVVEKDGTYFIKIKNTSDHKITVTGIIYV